MEEFITYFERFSPKAWLYKGMIDRDPDEVGVAARARGAASKIRVGCATVLLSATVFSNTAVATVDENHAQTPVYFGESPESSKEDFGELPPDHWPGVIASIRSAPMIREDDFQNFESIY